MNKLNALYLYDFKTEHIKRPIGVETTSPRFSWKLGSIDKSILQQAYSIRIFEKDSSKELFSTGRIESDQSIEVVAEGFCPQPMIEYRVAVTVWDNKDRRAEISDYFETGRMGVPFNSSWVEPVQEPTPSSMETERDGDHATSDAYENGERDFHEFRPAQYIRIPFQVKKPVRKARVYASAHGLYKLSVNGYIADNREFAPENSAYEKILFYQTYDITPSLSSGENVLGIVLGDGWWVGRVGTTGDCCQYGDTIGLLLDAEVEYTDGSKEVFTGENGVSSVGPIQFSDLFVGEKYDAGKELSGWDKPGFDDSSWLPVIPKEYNKEVLTGQICEPVTPYKVFTPFEIITTPDGDIVLDVGQVLAGNLEITLTCDAGHTIRMEHSEVLDEKGNYYNNILNINKEQTDYYITKDGYQSYRPTFTYHGFRYVKITGWPGVPNINQFKVYVYATEMEDLGYFHTSDERINQLQENIVWSQVSNTISIPTDCPQREKAGWTGDIMAFAPTLCFNRGAAAFLESWMANVRVEQMSQGEIPMIVPYLKAYATFLRDNLDADTSCGWGDAVLLVPRAVYNAYGDKRILEENYDAMKKWLTYIQGRAENVHPKGYESYSEERKERDKYLWSTDFHFGDWLVPSMVLGNPDAMAMNNTAYATMRYVAPAYYAFSAQNMAEIAEILGNTEDARYYFDLYEKIKEAYIAEYVKEDGSMDANLQGIYVITLQMGLVPDDIRPKMVNRLCEMIHENGDKLDTGFLSVLFLMDVLCNNGRSDVAYKILYQTGCPSWLYEVLSGGTTMWESWGAMGEDGTVSTYSYNHYAFGCVGDWMYRYIGGLQMAEPGYKRLHIEPHMDCGLTEATVSQETPYGKAEVSWKLFDSIATVSVTVPANTTADICLEGQEPVTVGSGTYNFCITRL